MTISKNPNTDGEEKSLRLKKLWKEKKDTFVQNVMRDIGLALAILTVSYAITTLIVWISTR
jgi:hypothetical protein